MGFPDLPFIISVKPQLASIICSLQPDGKAYLSCPGLVLVVLLDKGQRANREQNLKDPESQVKKRHLDSHPGPESGLRRSPEVLPVLLESRISDLPVSSMVFVFSKEDHHYFY